MTESTISRAKEMCIRDRYEFTCPCCDFEARGRTNLEDPEITVPCKCGNPVTMKWDRNKRMYHE